jgi:MFS transporter, FSR family, fosmidomycin resistance protein
VPRLPQDAKEAAKALAPVSPILFLVAAAHFFSDVYMGFLTPLYPIIVDKFSLSLSLVGVVSMVAALAAAVSQPLFGMLYDRFGLTRAIYLAPLATGVLVSSLGVASSFPVFLVLLFLGCLGSSAFHPKGASVTPPLSGGHPELGMAIFSAGGNLGYAAGPAAIAFFVTAWGLRAMPILAVPAAMVAATMFFLLPAKEIQRRTARVAKVSIRSLFADRKDSATLLRLVFINFCLNVSVRGLSTFLPVYMAKLSINVASIGVLFTLMLACGAVISVFAGAFSRRTGKRVLILVSATVGAPLALAGFLLFPSPAARALIILSGTVLTFTSPLLIVMAQKHSGGSPAMASSLIMGFSWGLAGLAMVPIGSIGELIGMKGMMLIVGTCPLLAIVSCLRLPRD